MDVPEKRCSKCGELKPATNEHFTTQARGKYGLYSICRDCCKLRDKQRYDDPDKRLMMKDGHKKWVAENRDKLSANERRYYSNNRVEIRARERIQGKARRRRYHEKHPEMNSKNRARRISAIGTHSNSDIELQFKTQNGKCWWCGKELKDKYHVDHRIALNRGGTNWPNNICISCPTCNLSKGDRFSWEWNGRLL